MAYNKTLQKKSHGVKSGKYGVQAKGGTKLVELLSNQQFEKCWLNQLLI